MLEIAGGIIIAVFALIFLGTLAKFWHKKITFGKVQKVLEMIVNNPPTATSSEEDNEALKKVQLVQFKCRYAENFIEDINSNVKEISDSGKEKLESYIQTCLATAQEVSDEFSNSAILHSISNLLSKSGQFERANKLIDLMVVDFMQYQAHELMNVERKKRIIAV